MVLILMFLDDFIARERCCTHSEPHSEAASVSQVTAGASDLRESLVTYLYKLKGCRNVIHLYVAGSHAASLLQTVLTDVLKLDFSVC